MALIRYLNLLIILSISVIAIGPAPIVLTGQAPLDSVIEASIYHLDGRVISRSADYIDFGDNRFYRILFTVDEGSTSQITLVIHSAGRSNSYALFGVKPWDEINLDYTAAEPEEKRYNNRPNAIENEEEMKRLSLSFDEGDIRRIIAENNITGRVIEGSTIEIPGEIRMDSLRKGPSIVLFLSLVLGVLAVEMYYRRRRP